MAFNWVQEKSIVKTEIIDEIRGNINLVQDNLACVSNNTTYKSSVYNSRLSGHDVSYCGSNRSHDGPHLSTYYPTHCPQNNSYTPPCPSNYAGYVPCPTYWSNEW